MAVTGNDDARGKGAAATTLTTTSTTQVFVGSWHKHNTTINKWWGMRWQWQQRVKSTNAEGEGHGNDNGRRMSAYAAIIDEGWNDALDPFLPLKTAGADDAHDRNNTTINHDDGGGQNAAEPTTMWEDGNGGSNSGNWQPRGGKDLMLSSEKETIEQNQACREAKIMKSLLKKIVWVIVGTGGFVPDHWPASHKCRRKQACLGPALNWPMDSHHHLAAWCKWHNNGKLWPIILTGAHVELICKNSTPIQPDSI
jgi:hypothetical protein